MKLLLLLAAWILGLGLSEAVSCIAFNGKSPIRCTGATYCVSEFKRSSSSSVWTISSAGCVETNLQIVRHLNQWRQPVANFAQYRCTGNLCNSVSPPSNIPPPPPTLQCVATGSNGNTTTTCMGTACVVQITDTKLRQGCANSAFTSLSSSFNKFCTTFSQSVQGRVDKGVYCACRGSNNCNQVSLISWGLANLQQTRGTCLIPGSTNNKPMQYCGISTIVNPNFGKINAYFGQTSTIPRPLLPLGCSKSYTSSNNSIVTCLCSGAPNCNQPSLEPTAYPTGFPTRPPFTRPTGRMTSHGPTMGPMGCTSFNGKSLSRCGGPTYCVSEFKRTSSSSPWRISSAGCVETNLPMVRYLNQWRQPVANLARYRCTGNLCNSALPPGNISPPPPTLQCVATGRNGNTTTTCMGTACIVQIVDTKLLQGCASETFSSIPSSYNKFCTTFSQSFNGKVGKGAYCACRGSNNCNQVSLMSWGLANLQKPRGTCLIPGSTNNKPWQYCGIQSVVDPSGRTLNAYFSQTSTLPLPVIPLGCSKAYQTSNDLINTYCLCSGSPNCNQPSLEPTAYPTGFPTRPPFTRPTGRMTTYHPWTKTWRPSHRPTGSGRPTWWTRPPWTPSHRPTMGPMPSGVFMVLLESFDNSAGGGRLFQQGRCDPFWFSGVDQCDIALQVCVEPLNSDPSMIGCVTEWVDLGQVTTNQNKATLNPGTAYGGWSNPMQYPLLPFAKNMGFQFKYAAFDIDNGGRQLIDFNLCSVRFLPRTPGVSFSCQHVRPNGYQASMRLSYFIGLGGHGPGPHPTGRPHPSGSPPPWSHRPSWHPSGRPSWRPSGRPTMPPWSQRPSWHPSGRPTMRPSGHPFLVDDNEMSPFLPKINM